MRVIYNEGRVVGLSAYELYVKQKLADGADPADIPTEAEWVTATITDARGGAMILKVPKNSTAGVHDFVLPTGTTLCGDGPMYATLFEGAVEMDPSDTWGTHVTDYGRAVVNTPNQFPVTPGLPADVPSKVDPVVMPDSYRDQCVDYMKINSAIAVQPGEWKMTGQTVPFKSLKPDFTQPGFIRIILSAPTKSDMYIMLTGFMSVDLIGEFAITEDFTQDYKDGQTLGPVVFPWVSKVQLLMTTDSLKGYLDWYLDATLTTDEYNRLATKEDKFYFTRKE